ncbi:hypothetical protein M231_00169 [Tremella mesenterica]|uniref:Uncharacterized protein n=1 Tax=Tremella mesenterica TaxID=5217 RepID=A0A4Q1BWQ6_TREME|nr:hypothetical protein M231_00169 [Tremella mesenterica]
MLRFLTLSTVVLLLLSLPVTHAARLTLLDDDGQTIIETVSTDQWDEVWTLTLSTIGVKVAQNSLTSTTTKGFVTNPAIASPTAVVAAGTIQDFSAYEASVSTKLASMSSSLWAQYTATASGYTTSSAHRTEVSLVGWGVLILLVAYGLAKEGVL